MGVALSKELVRPDRILGKFRGDRILARRAIARYKIGQLQSPVHMSDSIQQEARQILDTLAFTSFEQCLPLSCEFATIPARVGLYAFRHSSEGLLYIGKAKNLRDRLRSGHKAFLWGWLDRYDPDYVRIAFVTLNQWQKPGLLYELETLILQASNPPYNVKIPREL